MDEAAADRDAPLLLDMLVAARDAQSFLSGLNEDAFMASRLHQNAVIRSLEIIGEAAGKDSPSARSLHPDIPWREIIGMRHREHMQSALDFKAEQRFRSKAEIRLILPP